MCLCISSLCLCLSVSVCAFLSVCVSQSEHAKIGASLKNYGIDVFFAFGQLAAEAVLAAKKSGENLIAKHFEEKKALIRELNELPKESETILVKGSRGMKMEEVVEALLEK